MDVRICRLKAESIKGFQFKLKERLSIYNLSYKYIKMSEIREDPGCLTLSQDMMDERDFIA
ncbi:hypothetical protein IJL65_01960 [bacterium]|nr:hypothetical protein [bacterium]